MGLKEKDILKRVLFYGGNAIVALIFVSPLLWMIAASPETGGADILRHEQYQDVLAHSGHSWELC